MVAVESVLVEEMVLYCCHEVDIHDQAVVPFELVELSLSQVEQVVMVYWGSAWLLGQVMLVLS